MPMNPLLTDSLIGAGIGAAGGALTGEPGHRMEGALHGGVLGGASGALLHGFSTPGAMPASNAATPGPVHGPAPAKPVQGQRALPGPGATKGQYAPGWQESPAAKDHAEWQSRFRQAKSQANAESRASANRFDDADRIPEYRDRAERLHRAHVMADQIRDFYQGPPGVNGLPAAPTQWSAHTQVPMDVAAPWMHGVQSQTAARNAFRERAKYMHPDAGGDTEAMQALNAQWDAVRRHPQFNSMRVANEIGKTAALHYFCL